MNADKIIQSDVLDIIFENKNKDYGAYHLRKNYNKRLLQSIGVTCLFVMAIVLLQNMKPKKQNLVVLNPDNTRLIEVDLPKDQPKEPIKKPQQTRPQVATLNATAPVIFADPEVKDTIADNIALASSTLGTTNKTGDTNTTIDVDPGSPTTGDGDGVVEKLVEPVFDDVSVRDWAQVLPEFPGGMAALQKFMLKNLRQPDDIEAGQRIVVRVKFVVNKDGDISDIEIVQSGRSDLDAEVIRVVKKMPKWKAGLQNGKAVPVFFNMPVSFVNNEE